MSCPPKAHWLFLGIAGPIFALILVLGFRQDSVLRRPILQIKDNADFSCTPDGGGDKIAPQTLKEAHMAEYKIITANFIDDMQDRVDAALANQDDTANGGLKWSDYSTVTLVGSLVAVPFSSSKITPTLINEGEDDEATVGVATESQAIFYQAVSVE